MCFVWDMVPTGRIKPVGHGPDESRCRNCSCVFRTSYYLEHHLLKLSALQLNTKVLLKSKQTHTEQVKNREDIKNNTVGGRELDSVTQPSMSRIGISCKQELERQAFGPHMLLLRIRIHGVKIA